MKSHFQLLSFIIVWLLLPVSAHSGDNPSFTRKDYGLSAQSSILSVNDINNDDISDIISVSRFGLVSVFLGNGDGTFQKEEYFSPNAFITFLLSGDYNKDGNLDFVVNGKILLGNGTGGFDIHDINMGSGNLTYGASSDMNGDGYLDLVVGDHLNVLINNGDGTFHFDKSIFPDMSVQILSLNDYNNDGYPDLLIVETEEYASSVYYMPSSQDGSFEQKILVFGPYRSFEYAYAPPEKDFNSDGNLDLLIFFERSCSRLFIGDGKGNFTNFYKIGGEAIEGFGGLHTFYLIDMNNDTFYDIVLVTDGVGLEPRRNCLSYYPGNGDGTFGELSILDNTLPRSFPLAYGDFNSDGLHDFAAGTLDSIETPGLTVYIASNMTKVENNKMLASSFTLSCHPNPFNASVTISYRISQKGIFKIVIHDVLGRKVKEVFYGKQEPGYYTFIWKGDDISGKKVSSGIFFCTLTNESGIIVKKNKIMLMK